MVFQMLHPKTSVAAFLAQREVGLLSSSGIQIVACYLHYGDIFLFPYIFFKHSILSI